MASVALAHLTKIYPAVGGGTMAAVNSLDLNIADGELLVLIGPSGCGKTTTLRLVAGLEEVTDGTISMDGRVINRVAPKDRDLAMVFQNFALYPHMTAFENMAFGLKLRKLGRSETERRVRDAAAMLGLTACLERRPESLSGGERQRVALGRAVVRQPKAFLFDEPLSNLDAQLRVQLRLEIARLHARLAATMIYVTHDQVEAMTLGDRIAVMRDGVLQQVDKPLAVYRHPKNIFVAGFIGSPRMNFFHGSIARREGRMFFVARAAEPGKSGSPWSVRLEEGQTGGLAACEGKELVLGLRPEHITDLSAAPGAPEEHTVAVQAELSEPLGFETWLHAAAAGHSLVARLRSGSPVAMGAVMRLVFDMAQARFFDAKTGDAISS